MAVTKRQHAANWAGKIVRDEIAKKVFWLVLGLAALGIAAFFRRHQLSFSKLDITLAAIIILGSMAWITSEVYRRKSYRMPYYPRVRPHYEILSKRIEYRLAEDGQVHFSRTVKIRALVDNVDQYVDKYVWTGGDTALPSAGVGAESTQRILRAGIWTFYATTLPFSLRKGATHEFTTVWPPLPNWRDSQPFVSTSTEEPTKELTFELLIPEEYLSGPTFLCEELRGIESAYPFQTLRMDSDRGRFSWQIKPKLYRHYRIRWSWADGEALRSMPEAESEDHNDG